MIFRLPSAIAIMCVFAPALLSAQANPADVKFMQGMIGHHSQALVMTALVSTNGASPAIRSMAQRITISQRDEIKLMQQWLRQHGQQVPVTDDTTTTMMHDMSAMHGNTATSGGATAMRHDDMSAMMPGMLTGIQLESLRSARDTTFDRLFLTYMIQHHRGALSMVADLLATPRGGEDSDVFRFASDVDADQRAEIARMEQMLENLPRRKPE